MPYPSLPRCGGFLRLADKRCFADNSRRIEVYLYSDCVSFKLRARDTGLTYDREQSACLYFFVIRHRNRYCSARTLLLHDNVASTTPYFDKPML